jgi:hypothetical protein
MKALRFKIQSEVSDRDPYFISVDSVFPRRLSCENRPFIGTEEPHAATHKKSDVDLDLAERLSAVSSPALSLPSFVFWRCHSSVRHALANIAMIAAGNTSTGGLATLTMRKLRGQAGRKNSPAHYHQRRLHHDYEPHRISEGRLACRVAG